MADSAADPLDHDHNRDRDRDHDHDRAALRETLAALEIPRRGLLRFLSHNRAFCEAHGGRRVYGELLAIFDACEAELSDDTAGGQSS